MNLSQIFKTGTSCFKALNQQDFLKRLFMGTGAGVLTAVQNSVAAHGLKLDWQNIGQAAVSAATIYLLKNYFTKPQPAS